MKVLVYAPIKSNHAAGISFSVPNYLKSLNHTGVKLKLNNLFSKPPLTEMYDKGYDLYVFNSFFKYEYLFVLLYIRSLKPIILIPRGALSRKNKYSIKKHIYLYFFTRLIDLFKVDMSIHYLSEGEKELARLQKFKSMVIGNSIEIKYDSQPELKKKFQQKTIIYIGRFDIHQKGLDRVIKYLVQYRHAFSNAGWKFKCYGPNSDGKKWLSAKVKEEKLHFVSVNDEIYGIEKEKVMIGSTFNILASISEGYPMSVLETSQYYTPQILSKGTNLIPELSLYGNGIVFDEYWVERAINTEYAGYKTMCEASRSYSLSHDIASIGSELNVKYRLGKIFTRRENV